MLSERLNIHWHIEVMVIVFPLVPYRAVVFFRVGSLFVCLKSACCLCCKIVEQSFASTILTIEFPLLPCLLPSLSPSTASPLQPTPSAPNFLSALSKTGMHWISRCCWFR